MTKKIYNFNLNRDDAAVNKNVELSSGAFDIELTDELYVGSSDNYYLSGDDLTKFGLHNIVTAKQQPSVISLQDVKIYRYPKLNLPRQKFDLLKERFDCKITRDSDKADIHVVSYKFLESLFTYNWYSDKFLDYRDFVRVCIIAKEKGMFTDGALNELREKLSEMDQNSIVAFNQHYYNGGHNAHLWREQFLKITKPFHEAANLGSRLVMIEKSKVKDYNRVVNSVATVVFDTAITEIIDEDLAIIEDDQYGTIEQMIISNDIDNRTLALEMLANSNIEKSFNVVSSLYWWHYDWMKATNNWNTVNVKAMRSRLKSYEGGHDTNNVYSYNRYIMALTEDRKLTKFAVDNTRSLFLNKCLNVMVGPGAEVFKVDLEHLVLKEKYNNSINE
jgi:hypothetical protein